MGFKSGLHFKHSGKAGWQYLLQLDIGTAYDQRFYS